MWQMGGLGPMSGQNGHFRNYAPEKVPYAIDDRYVAESRRLLGVLDARLKGRRWIMGDEYTIADMAILPWVRNLVQFYGAGELVGYADFVEVQRVLEAFVARPAVQAGLNQPPRV